MPSGPQVEAGISRESLAGLADDIWAQHSQLQRFQQDCKDRDIAKVIGIAREALSVAGSIADAKIARRQ